MSVIITGIGAPLSADKERLISLACGMLKVSRSELIDAQVYKVSLDARKQDKIRLAASVYLTLDDNTERVLCEKYPFCSAVKPYDNELHFGDKEVQGRIIVVGFGPCGMMAALTLAENGYRPIVLERGSCVEKRVEAVSRFWNEGVPSDSTNVQFGEGGAGTFSDGKLTTRINDIHCRAVMEKFVEHGAPEDILTSAKPHVGTDKLRPMVRSIRERIIACGGEVRFDCLVESIGVSSGKVVSVTAGGESIPAEAVILAVGHSARDTFEMLLTRGVFIEPKAFSVGARIEHTQKSVDESLYGRNAGSPLLPKGEYRLSRRRKDGRACYTFCMCPGGYVVPAQSEYESVVTNGMSEFARDGVNANSAVAVSVSPDDFGRNPLDGVEFARSIERRAYSLKSYAAPAVTVGNFLDKRCGLDGANVVVSYARGVYEGDFDKLFPDFVTDMMREGLRDFGCKMRCFADRNAVLTAPETRTSSPVRISRGEGMESVSMKGLYPCGEGAGYAGGIVSASVDGFKAALRIMEIYKA